LEHYKDLGDSEQTPCDLATLVDYTHLTAMLAPRPSLLTFNAKDNCCFESGYALPPLEKAARPMFKLFDRETALRTHINFDPGDHNFGKDNREALYRLIGAHWFRESKDYDAREIDVKKEIKKAEELAVELPKNNADFNTLARGLMKDLPRTGAVRESTEGFLNWKEANRNRLEDVLPIPRSLEHRAEKVGVEKKGDVLARYWKVDLSREGKRHWTVPVVELQPKESKGVAVLIGDSGRGGLQGEASRLLKTGQRLFLVDPFYNGESSIDNRAYLFALMVATVGDRALGLQVAQLQAVARWVKSETGVRDVTLHSVGPRASVTALVAAGMGEPLFSNLVLERPLGSLKELIEENRSLEQSPELFCFGLLEAFDVSQLAALMVPRPVHIMGAGDRAKKEFANLKKLYTLFGKDFDPLQGK
jgi:hypothetical protein